MDEFHDKVAGQIDKRKVEKLIDDGIITAEEVANAPWIKLTQSCTCEAVEPNENERCPKCLSKYSREQM